MKSTTRQTWTGYEKKNKFTWFNLSRGAGRAGSRNKVEKKRMKIVPRSIVLECSPHPLKLGGFFSHGQPLEGSRCRCARGGNGFERTHTLWVTSKWIGLTFCPLFWFYFPPSWIRLFEGSLGDKICDQGGNIFRFAFEEVLLEDWLYLLNKIQWNFANLTPPFRSIAESNQLTHQTGPYEL